jgi:S1-C subfamily serine protease
MDTLARALTLLVAAGIWLAAGSPATAQKLEVPESLETRESYRHELFDRIAPSVVFIARDDSMGSGFFVSEDGLVLTNAHVVGERDEVTVVLHDGRKLTARVVERADDDIDLALIRVPVGDIEPLRLGTDDELRVGSWVASVGHGSGGVWTFTRGMVTNIYPAEKGRPVFQTQIPLNPGASGGPIFDERGRVVGVVTKGLVESNSVNFAVRIDIAFESLDRLDEQRPRLTVEVPGDIPVFVDGETVGTGPEVRVEVEAGEPVEVFAIIDGEMRKTTVTFPETKRVDLSVVDAGDDE